MNYLILFFGFFFINAPSEKSDLTLTVHNIQNIKGNLEIGIYTDAEHFMEAGYTFRNISVAVNSNSETFTIKDLPKGTYAISMYHDENSNGKCDRNIVGLPKEPYAFSNNFRPKLSKPTFADCKFDLKSNPSMKIELIN